MGKVEMVNWKFAFLLSIVIVLTIIPHVYAASDNDQVNLLDLPKKVAEALGIPEYAGKLLSCTFILFMVLLPIAIFSKGNMLLMLMIGILCLGFFVAVGWLEFWFILIIILVVAGLWSGKVRGWLT
jgi:hypothetical protein